MKAQLGYAMLAIGTAASVLGVATLGAGIHLQRPALMQMARRYVFVEAIPKSPVGKLLRRKLVAGEYEAEPADAVANEKGPR